MKILLIIILIILAVLSFSYGCSVMMLNSGTIFFTIWFLLGVFLLLIAFLTYKNLFSKIPKYILFPVCILLCIGFGIYIYTQVLVIKGFNYESKKDLDYILVLGAQVRENGPSAVLQYRLDAAIEYLNDNPNTLVIVTGGQGANEPTTEAEGMKKYLIKKGIDDKRILIEDQSTNTIENIKNSMKLYNLQDKSVGIVTSNYHLYRAVQIGKKQGLNNVYGIKAYSTPYYLLHNALRECFGILKDLLQNNM